MSQALDPAADSPTQPRRRAPETEPEPEVLPLALAGNWIAWSGDGLPDRRLRPGTRRGPSNWHTPLASRNRSCNCTRERIACDFFRFDPVR